MSTIIMVRPEPGKLVPASAFDFELMDGLPRDVEHKASLTRPRSLPHHNLYWKVLTVVVEGTELGGPYPTAGHLHRALLLSLGYVTAVTPLFGGAPVLIPDSTAFKAMDQGAFGTFFDKAMALLADLIGCDPVALVKETL